MLKYKTSKITEAMNDLFDAALYEADPAVTIVGNDNSELEASKSNLEHFISTAFSDHGEDISNISLTYDGNEALLAIDVNDQANVEDLTNLYQSKFDLQGKEDGSWSVSDVESSGNNSFTIRLNLGGEVSSDTGYSEDDIVVLTSGTGAEVVVEDISYNNNLDELIDLINSKNFTSDDDVVEFIETSDEVDALRGNSLDDKSNGDIDTPIAEESEKLTESARNIELLYRCLECGKNFEYELDDSTAVQDIVDDIDKKGDCDPMDYNLPSHCDWCGSMDVRIEGVKGLNEDEDFDDDGDFDPSWDEQIGDAIWDAIDNFNVELDFDYHAEGGFGDYENLISLVSTGRTIASISDQDLKGKHMDEVTAYVKDQIIQGFKDYREDLNDSGYTEDMNDEEIADAREAVDNVLGSINESEEVKESMKLVEYSKEDLDLYKKLTEDEDDDYAWLVEQVENAMNPVFRKIDDKFGTDMGFDSSFCTNLCEGIEEELDDYIKSNRDSEYEEEYDESEKLTEQVVPASELGFKHQELAKIEDEVALISKLKGEDPGNELYTDLLGCFDKAIEVLKDAIGEEPVGTVVGQEDVSINIDADNKLGGSEDESISDLDASEIPDEEVAPEEDVDLEEPIEEPEEEEM